MANCSQLRFRFKKLVLQFGELKAQGCMGLLRGVMPGLNVLIDEKPEPKRVGDIRLLPVGRERRR